MARHKPNPPSPLIPDATWSQLQKDAEDDRRQVEKWRAADDYRERLYKAALAVEKAGHDYEKKQEAGEAYLREFVRTLAEYKALVAQSPDPEANKVKLPSDGMAPPGWPGFDPKAFPVALLLFLRSDTDPDEVVRDLARLAAEHPGAAAAVGHWLRTGIRLVCESYQVEGPAAPAEAEAGAALATPAGVARLLTRVEAFLEQHGQREGEGLEILEGAIRYGKYTVETSGQPLAIIRAFYFAHHWRLDWRALGKDAWDEKSCPSKEAVKNGVKEARKPLRELASYLVESLDPEYDPLPYVDDRHNLAWKMVFPPR
jgi:hypothetical protein